MPTYGKIKLLDFCCHTVNYTKQIYFLLIYFAMNFLDFICESKWHVIYI